MMVKKKKANTSQSKGISASKPSIKRYLELFGFIGAAVGIAVVIFQVGQYFGTKAAKREEFKSFIEYIEQIREGIRIENVTCQPSSLYLGETCGISIRVINETPYECDLWVGTSATAKDGKEIWNTSQDRLVTITPDGITSVKRLFTFPNEAIEGVYDLQVNLWYGRKSDPSQSERISSAALREQIEVMKHPKVPIIRQGSPNNANAADTKSHAAD